MCSILNFLKIQIKQGIKALFLLKQDSAKFYMDMYTHIREYFKSILLIYSYPA